MFRFFDQNPSDCDAMIHDLKSFFFFGKVFLQNLRDDILSKEVAFIIIDLVIFR